MLVSKNILAVWLPLAVVATAAIGAAYVMVQQDLRQSADDPQIQIAEDAAYLLSKGLPASEVDAGLDLGKSQSAFMAVYDDAGKPIRWSMTLDGKAPTPPAGVFESAKKNGGNRVTWQPNPQVRVALVVVPYVKPDKSTGFVASGRSLRDVELRVHKIGTLALAVWVVTLFASLLSCLIFSYRKQA